MIPPAAKLSEVVALLNIKRVVEMFSTKRPSVEINKIEGKTESSVDDFASNAAESMTIAAIILAARRKSTTNVGKGVRMTNRQATTEIGTTHSCHLLKFSIAVEMTFAKTLMNLGDFRED